MMKHEMYRDYEQGMDIACIASRYNLTCEEARELLGVEFQQNWSSSLNSYVPASTSEIVVDPKGTYSK